MASDFEGTTVSVDDVRAGYASHLLAEADVVVAVDVNTHEEEVVRGQHEWDLASVAEREDLAIVRVELDMEAGDLEWLVETVETVAGGVDREGEEDFERGEDDEE